MLFDVMSGVRAQVRILGTRRFCKEVVETQRIEKTLNQVTLLGRVGADPQLRGTKTHPVVIFSIATHSNYKQGDDDYIQRTDWHRICVFRPALREAVHTYLKKGQRTMVQGRLSYGQTPDIDGNTKIITTIIADDIVFFN